MALALTIDELRERIDILDVIGHYLRLDKAGVEYRGVCPFHDDKRPSMYVNAAKGVWLCRACGEGGTAIDFIMKKEHVEFVEACEIIAQQMGFELASNPQQAERVDERGRLTNLCQLAAKLFQKALWNSARGQVARDYLAQRGITEAVARQFQLGYAPAGWDKLTRYLERDRQSLQDAETAGLVKARERGQGYYDRFRHRLMFPIIDERGRTVAFGGRILDPEDEPKYLNSAETPIFSKRRVLYGLPYAVGQLEAGAVVVEGYMDVIALHQHGVPVALATLGTALTPEHLRLLRRHTRRVVLCYDSDVAGIRATDRAAAAFTEEEMDGRVLTLPAGQDPDDFVRSAGADAFREQMAGAPDLIDYRLSAALAAAGDDAASRARAVSETAVAILGDIRDEVRQGEYVRRIAEWWSGRAAGLQESLEHTLRRALREQQGRGRFRGPREDSPDRSEPVAPAGRRALAERALLTLLLRRPALWSQLEATETEALLSGPTVRTVAHAARTAAGQVTAEALAAELDEAGRTLLAELLCSDEPVGEPDRWLAELRYYRLEDETEALRSARRVQTEDDPDEAAEHYRRLAELERRLMEARAALVSTRQRHDGGDDRS